MPFCVDIFPDNVIVFLKVTGASIDCWIVIPDTSIFGIILESSSLTKRLKIYLRRLLFERQKVKIRLKSAYNISYWS